MIVHNKSTDRFGPLYRTRTEAAKMTLLERARDVAMSRLQQCVLQL